MSTVKLSLASLSVPEKIQFARRVANAMADNDTIFPGPPRDPSDLNDKADMLQLWFNSSKVYYDVAKTKTQEMQDIATTLCDWLTEEANYVQQVSAGNEHVIMLAGMDVKTPPAPIGPLHAPTGLKALASDFAGQVPLRWKGVKGAKSYMVQSTTDITGNGNWKTAGTCTRGQFSVNKLTSGAKLWVRVRAIGTAGPGAWSDPATKVVP